MMEEDAPNLDIACAIAGLGMGFGVIHSADIAAFREFVSS